METAVSPAHEPDPPKEQMDAEETEEGDGSEQGEGEEAKEAEDTDTDTDTEEEEEEEEEGPQTCGGGRYTILRTIGQGGMGAIYQVHDTKLNIDVALKRLLPTVEGQEMGVQRFLREAQAIAALNHFNIIRIYDINEDEQGHYITMEFVDGENLRQLIKRLGKIELPGVLKFARQIAQGLSYAHKSDIVHRDIKPANVLLAEDDVPKIVDFGLAAVSSGDELSQTGYAMGTLSYMPPEQKADAKNVDGRADIYALGATIYEMATGNSPSMIRESDIPLPIREIVIKCVEPKPEDRYQTCLELIAALDASTSAPKSAAVEESATSVGQCASCGHRNPQDVSFCENCGAGLFEECPQCRHENRLGVGYCGSCGLDLEQYRCMLAHLETAREMIEQHRYSAAVAESEAAIGIMPEDDSARRMLDEAKGLQDELDGHKSRAQEFIQQSAYEAARDELRAALALRPEDKGLTRAIMLIPKKIIERDIRRAIEAGNEFVEATEFQEAAESYDKALALAPSNEPVAQAVARAKRRLKHRCEVFIQESVVTAAKHVDAREFEPAIKLLEQVLALQPEHAEAKRLFGLASQAEGTRRTEAVDSLLAEADAYERRKRYEIALARLQAAHELLPSRRDILERLRVVKELVVLRNMVYIDAGEFIFGEGKVGLLRRSNKIDLPAFYIDRYPVTNAEYKRFCDETGRRVPSQWAEMKVAKGMENHPVVNVTFADAEAYAEWVGKRIPTEEEWEKAARGPDGRKYPWGSELEANCCNLGTDGTSPVDRYPRGQSPYGVLDMVGNCWEWCDVRYPTDHRARVRRGGVGKRLGCTARSKVNARHSHMDLGFRCAKDAKGPPPS